MPSQARHDNLQDRSPRGTSEWWTGFLFWQRRQRLKLTRRRRFITGNVII